MRKRTLPHNIDKTHYARCLPLLAWMCSGQLGHREEALWIYLMFRLGSTLRKEKKITEHVESLASIGDYLGMARQHARNACDNLVRAKLIYADTRRGRTATTTFRARFAPTSRWTAYFNKDVEGEPKIKGDPDSDENFGRLYGHTVYLTQWDQAASLGPAARHIFRMAVIFRKVPPNLFAKDMWAKVRDDFGMPINTFQKAWKRLVAAGLIDENGVASSGKPMDAASLFMRRAHARAS